MKLNISYPATGCQKLFEVEDDKKLKIFYEKRMGHEINADPLGEEWKGYVFRISGGNDKQGFPMKQGVLTTERVRLLLSKGHSCYRPRRKGERKRKSVRGCIVDANLSVLALVIVKKGIGEIPGLTDTSIPRKLGPKRASKIRKLFNLDKKDDVRRYVIRHPLPAKEGRKPKTKAPKIQRLLTPSVLQHRRQKIKMKQLRREKNKQEAAEYAKLLSQRRKEAREKLHKKNRRSAKRLEKLNKGKKATTKKAVSDKKPAASQKGSEAETTKKLEKSSKSSAKLLAKPAIKTAAAKPVGKQTGEKKAKAGVPIQKPDDGKGKKRPADTSSAPAAKKLAAKSGDTKSADKKPQKIAAPKKEGAKTPLTQKEKPTVDKPGPKKDKPAGDRPAPKKDKPSGEKPAPKKDKPSGEKPAPKKDKPSGDKPAPKKDKPSGDKPAPKKDKPSGDKKDKPAGPKKTDKAKK